MNWQDWIDTAQYGKCEELMPRLPDACVHGIVTDPPYGLKFMGKEWDRGIPGVPFWLEALRVAMPGAYLLAFGGTRTFHRLMCAIEDAGWEIRDTIMWVYGSGFPKSHDVSKAIDRAAGVERKAVGDRPNYRPNAPQNQPNADPTAWQDRSDGKITLPATEAAKHWRGWGTALKPAWEPIIVARKPLEGTVAENVLKYGTGAMNIDRCRVETEKRDPGFRHGRPGSMFQGGNDGECDSKGRWPANLIHDGSEEVVRGFPVSSITGKRTATSKAATVRGTTWGTDNHESTEYTDSGSAARFFYCAKASRAERGKDNKHPTVKPLKLMKYLVTLVSREDQIILDMFAGSGSTLVACKKLGRRFIGFEKDRQDALTCNKRLEQTQWPSQEAFVMEN